MNQPKNKKVKFCKFLDRLDKKGRIQLKPIGLAKNLENNKFTP